MKGINSINVSLSNDLYKNVKKYAKDHEISIEEVVRMAINEFFDIGPLLEQEQKRKSIWDIIDIPED
jgi:hypothetical protein